MFCPSCGKKIPDSASVCGFCGTRIIKQPAQNYQPPPVQQGGGPTHIVVKTSGGGSFLSDIGSCFNLVIGGVLLCMIVLVLLLFFCIIKVSSVNYSSGYPQVVYTAWSTLYNWQQNQCQQRTTPPSNNTGGKTSCGAGTVDCHGVCCATEKCLDQCPCGQAYCATTKACAAIGKCTAPPPDCNSAKTQSQCVTAGGTWRHIYMDPGPSKDICVCPGVSPFG